MVLEDLVSQSLQTLKENYSSNKLLLIHPSSRYRTLLIASILKNPFCPVTYYSIGMDDTAVKSFLSNLTRDIYNQNPFFGRGALTLDTHEEDFRAAAALAADLGSLYDEDFLLIIDEYDRIDDNPEMEQFFDAFLQSLASNCHLLINSRTLPRLPWVALVAKHQAVVLKDSRLLSRGFYSEKSGETPDLEIYSLGSGYIILNGKMIDTWDGNLPRLLFFFTLDRPMVTRAEICATFWPDLSIEQAVNVFHVTKRRLHKALGCDVMIHENGLYRINPDLNITYDVLDFVSALVSAREEQDPYKKADNLLTAIEVYHSHYLQGYDDPWIALRREDYKEGYIEALTSLAKIREENGLKEVALGLNLRAVSEAQKREDIHREVIRLYGLLGRRIEAAEHYNEMKKFFHDRYRIEPSEETKRAYREAIGA